MWARLIIIGLLAIGIGCGKKPASNPPTPESAGAAVDPTAGAPSDAQLAALLNDLTQAVRRFSAEQRRVPASLDEVVAGGYLTSVPAAPAGKRFAISKSLQVYLANQ